MKKGKFPARAERLRLFFNQFSIRNVDAAKRLGLNRSAFISQLLNKDATVTTDVAIRIGKAYPDLNVEWLLHGEGEMLKHEIPAVNQVNEDRIEYNRTKGEDGPLESFMNLLKDQERLIKDLLARVERIEKRLE